MTKKQPLFIEKEIIDQIRDEADKRIEEVFFALDMKCDGCFDCESVRCSCKIHNGDNKTAFSYFRSSKSWACFTGQCHEQYGSSIFGLVRGVLETQTQKPINFVESVKWLGNLLGIEVYGDFYVDPEKAELNKILSEARLNKEVKASNNEIKPHKERFSPFPLKAISNKFEISKYFSDKFSVDTLKKFYIGDCSDRNKPMYNRSYCVILDESGQIVIGVSGRTWDPECQQCGSYHKQGKGCPEDNLDIRAYPKWLHYGFSSSGVLYNFWNAKEHIKQTGVAIITEGPKEIWWLDQYGVKNAVSIFGLNISQYHIKKLIETNTLTLVIALDNDERGIKAMEKLNKTLGIYFKIININNILKSVVDIDDLDDKTMKEQLVPYIKSLNRGGTSGE